MLAFLVQLFGGSNHIFETDTKAITYLRHYLAHNTFHSEYRKDPSLALFRLAYILRLSAILLNSIAKRDLAKLQRVQHCLARVVLRAPRFSSSLPLLILLHWLPVTYRINFKLSTLTHRALSTQQPCLASLLHLSNIHRQLR